MNPSQTIRFAAVQLEPKLGDVEANLAKAQQLVRQAISTGATWILLPELFTTGIGFDDSMLEGHRSLDGEPTELLRMLAVEDRVLVGGSFLAESGGQVFNTFVLATPDGRIQTHDKDFPSGPIEHAYYAGGEDAEFRRLLNHRGVEVDERVVPTRIENRTDGVFDAPDGRIGAVLCWEMIRYRTVARLRGKVDFVLVSSAWPMIDPDFGFPGMTREQIVGLNSTLLDMVKTAPVTLAKLLGVPVIHANLVGAQRMSTLFDQPVDVVTQLCGESRIVDCHGTTLANRPGGSGEGVIVADVTIDRSKPAEIPSDRFWIPDMPPLLQALWYEQGALGRRWYLDRTGDANRQRPSDRTS